MSYSSSVTLVALSGTLDSILIERPMTYKYIALVTAVVLRAPDLMV